MGLDLSRVREREALVDRRKPHWQRLRPGCYVGFCPSTKEGAGTWSARAYDEERQRYRQKALGHLGSVPSRDQFALAKKEAEAFAIEVETGGLTEEKIETVSDACRRYEKSNPDAVGRFRRYVHSDPIGTVKLAKLRRHHLHDWRDRLAQKPALVSRSKKGPQITRTRAPSSINRDMAILRAALNRVLAPGTPGTEAAWQEALKSIRNADRQRTLYLDRDQRRALLGAIDPEAEPFVRTLCLLPLRPGAVSTLTVSDLDKRTSELTIGKDKSGKPRRILLPSAAAKLLARRAKRKSGEARYWPAPMVRHGTSIHGSTRLRTPWTRPSYPRERPHIHFVTARLPIS